MPYAILRTQKLSTNTAVRGSLKHAFRAQNTPNADPSRAEENTFSGAASVEEAMGKYEGKLPQKVRENGVRCIEYLMTGSPEHLAKMSRDDQDAYFSDCLKWLEKKHGAENVICSGIHRDETTPHMYAYVVPLDERGKLNCRKFLGGRDALSQMQTDFARDVAEKYGLERGEERSKASHTKVKEYYGRIQKGGRLPNPPASDFEAKTLKKTLFSKTIEHPEDVKKRVMGPIMDEVLNMHAVFDKIKAELKDAQNARKKAEESLRHLKPLEGFRRLSSASQGVIKARLDKLLADEKEAAARRPNDRDYGR